MNLTKEKLNAIISSVRERGKKIHSDQEKKIRGSRAVKNDSKLAYRALKAIPPKIKKELNIDYQNESSVLQSIVDARKKFKRQKQDWVIKNEIVLIAMSCENEQQVLRSASKINPFQE